VCGCERERKRETKREIGRLRERERTKREIGSLRERERVFA
jgi:hypothetical protein